MNLSKGISQILYQKHFLVKLYPTQPTVPTNISVISLGCAVAVKINMLKLTLIHGVSQNSEKSLIRVVGPACSKN